LNDGLQPLGVEPSDATEDLVEKTGFGKNQESGASGQNHFFFLKYHQVNAVETAMAVSATQ
jgi:hypothetical protein